MRADQLIDFVESQKPKFYLEVGEEALEEMRKMRDDSGRFLWSLDLPSGEMQTFLGYPIKVVSGSGVRLITEITDKTNIVKR